MEELLFSPLILFLILAWTLPWTPTLPPPSRLWRAPGIVALWRAAKNSHKWWFLALFLLNTLAILEIIYIFYFAKKIKKP